MSVGDKIFWWLISAPVIPCIISFIVGGIVAIITMSILNAISKNKDSNAINCNDCYYFNNYLEGGEK